MISHPVAVKFCNEKVRVTARQLADLMLVIRQFMQELDDDMLQLLQIDPALFHKVEDLTLQDYATLTPDVYEDGSPYDGRRQISNVEVLAWLRIIRFLYNAGVSEDERVEKIARKIAFAQG